MIASSSSVYGDQPELPKVESMALRPRSPYAASKAAVEHLAAALVSELWHVDGVPRHSNVLAPPAG